jgi:hypothetical protein
MQFEGTGGVDALEGGWAEAVSGDAVSFGGGHRAGVEETLNVVAADTA